MSGAVPVVTIKTKNGPVDINLSDFDPAIHERAEVTDLKPLDPSKQTAIYGSSKQPESWTLADGSVLELGTVVRVAFERSGLTEAKWNKLKQDDREDKIAAVVAEMVPVQTAGGFKVGKNGKKGDAAKFVILDGSGKPFGEAEFDTQEAAEAQIAILNGEGQA